jgi:hypothetical protein
VAFVEYATDYVSEEGQAKRDRRGLWDGTFVMPAAYRKGVQQGGNRNRLAVTAAAETCQIKGNIARSGEHIYHVPGGHFYSRTKIDESAGERWFCSEQEAEAAGWRRSMR